MIITKGEFCGMGYSALKKKAASITSGRGLKPDALYMLYAFFLGITIIGLPISYCIMLEYRKYLRLCLKEYDEADEAERARENKVYDYQNPMSIMFEYKLKSALGAVKAVLLLLLPVSLFFNMPHLSEERNTEVKVGLIQLKMYFVYIFCAAVVCVFLLGLIIFSGSWLCTLICALLIVCTVVILFKPFAVYCQAYVIYEKECLEMPSEDEECDEDDEEE